MKYILIIAGLLSSLLTYAQELDTLKTSPSIIHSITEGEEEINARSIKEWFAKGSTHGSIRYQFMGTINEGALSDYWANAMGARLYYQTARFHGFEWGAGFNAVFNIGSSDLTDFDPQIGKGSRWEQQLFDMTDLENKYDLGQLEEFYIKYHYHGSFLQFGKLTINTPLVNEQDSRMKPTSLSGLWSEVKPAKTIKINAGWFNKVSPRSTANWYHIEDAIGLYGRGSNPDGTASGYAGNIDSKGLGIFGLSYSPDSNLKLQLWDYYLENVLNANFLQVDFTPKNYELGLQYLREDQINNGGNRDPNKAYFPEGHTTNLFSGKAGLKKKKWKASINYTQALNTGRFTFPREFGTAKLYAFISRHRVEGLGNFQTLTLKYNYYPLKDNSLDVGLYLARTHTNGIDHLELNKYGFLTYNQLNLDVRYKFKNHLEGLDIKVLYLLDRSNNSHLEDLVYIYNKTNLSHLNLVMNYSF